MCYKELLLVLLLNILGFKVLWRSGGILWLQNKNSQAEWVRFLVGSTIWTSLQGVADSIRFALFLRSQRMVQKIAISHSRLSTFGKDEQEVHFRVLSRSCPGIRIGIKAFCHSVISIFSLHCLLILPVQLVYNELFYRNCFFSENDTIR